MEKNPFLFYLVVILIGIVLFSGCSSHESEINQAISYLESGNSRLAFLTSSDFSTIWVGTIKANSSAAKSDYSEAANILNNIPMNDLNKQDQTDLKASIVMVNADIEMTDFLNGPFSDYVENAQTYNQTTDPQTAARSVNAMKSDLQNMKNSLDQMNSEIGGISVTDLSPQVRTEVIWVKSTIQSLKDTITKTSNMLENTCYVKCNSGEILGVDCQCHPACGTTYCPANAVCCGGHCLTPCPYGYVQGSDCICHPECGNNLYCAAADAVCCGGNCIICPYGHVVGTDCMCHQECGYNTYCPFNSICCGGTCYTGCPYGYVMGNDCLCH